jgi:hypothetical protein
MPATEQRAPRVVGWLAHSPCFDCLRPAGWARAIAFLLLSASAWAITGKKKDLRSLGSVTSRSLWSHALVVQLNVSMAGSAHSRCRVRLDNSCNVDSILLSLSPKFLEERYSPVIFRLADPQSAKVDVPSLCSLNQRVQKNGRKPSQDGFKQKDTRKKYLPRGPELFSERFQTELIYFDVPCFFILLGTPI